MKNYKDVTTLIFDLGGVIVDLDWNLCIRNFEKIGVEHMDKLVSTTLQKGFILDYELGFISDDEFRAEVRKYASREVTDDQIDSAWTSLLVKIPSEKLELLRNLKKKYRILMLSNTNNLSFAHSETMFNVDGHSVNDYFDKCYLSYKMHLAKPTPEIFQALLDDSGLKAEKCLFLDDGIHNVIAAEKLGFKTEFIKPYSGLDEWQFLKELN